MYVDDGVLYVLRNTGAHLFKVGKLSFVSKEFFFKSFNYKSYQTFEFAGLGEENGKVLIHIFT